MTEAKAVISEVDYSYINDLMLGRHKPYVDNEGNPQLVLKFKIEHLTDVELDNGRTIIKGMCASQILTIKQTERVFKNHKLCELNGKHCLVECDSRSSRFIKIIDEDLNSPIKPQK